jgi:hypothetical protein
MINVINADLDQVVYYVNNNELIEAPYREYLDDFGTDLCTSPRGCENREFIEERTELVYEDDNGNEVWESELNAYDDFNLKGESVKGYDIMRWNAANRREFTGYSYEDRDEAESHIYALKEMHAQANDNAPHYEFTREAIIADIADGTGRSVEVITRHLAIREVAEVRRAFEIARAAASRERAKQAAIAEAATIHVDQQFISDMQAAAGLGGKNRSEACATAFSALLVRLEIIINSDFWQVFRSVKKNANL